MLMMLVNITDTKKQKEKENKCKYNLVSYRPYKSQISYQIELI